MGIFVCVKFHSNGFLLTKSQNESVGYFTKTAGLVAKEFYNGVGFTRGKIIGKMEK